MKNSQPVPPLVPAEQIPKRPTVEAVVRAFGDEAVLFSIPIVLYAAFDAFVTILATDSRDAS